ncbi:HD-GYP domain-containing protein [Roseibium alexandrii]|uniref:Putative domain HDIG n=1 Tax=Roseibium alexandrii (strain DSM 17067 / NCIMB 14079 / DFL-11) TaxID=244592 RepID=A0A5E8GZG2_ROSAD|nr:HD domain-containing phosphohydrolase [Roseibium alexandrii]EEE45011.1 putative domain HDIG [Roseibium alexandrii DFL-11]
MPHSEVILISDGPLPMDSPVRKIPFFFRARLIDMAKVSPKTSGEASVAIIELLGSSKPGMSALKSSWGSIAEIPVIGIIDKSDRREMTQAAALGEMDLVDREAPLALLLHQVKKYLKTDILKDLPKDTPERTAQAFSKANAFLETLCMSAVSDASIQIRAMEDSAKDALSAIDLEGLLAWMQAVESHHSPTYSHSLKVAGLAGAFARHLKWSEADCREMVAGGLVHDIGKMRIPLTILDKPGRLTDEERSLIAKHPVFGQEILKPRLEVPYEIKRMAIQHHEYLDGSGYPNHLKADRISQKVRVMTICDIFTALTEERAYKEPMPPRQAIAMMKNMGPKLDQDLLRQFSDMILDRVFAELSRPVSAAGGGAAA